MATNTKNFNFKKPDESDFYSIQDQNGNWDLADEELQKLNEPAFEDYTTGTSVPPAATALEALKSKIKLPVWMSNVVAFCKGCCTLAMIVNNCVSSDADKPLAAAQGKALQDQLTKLYSDLHMTSESKRITVNGNQHNIKIDKIGNLLCVCNITLNTVTFNGSAFDVYTDPFDVSYRPKSTCVSPLSINGGEAMMEVMMLPDGRINLWNPNYKGNATMPMRGTLIWTV